MQGHFIVYKWVSNLLFCGPSDEFRKIYDMIWSQVLIIKNIQWFNVWNDNLAYLLLDDYLFFMPTSMLIELEYLNKESFKRYI